MNGLEHVDPMEKNNQKNGWLLFSVSYVDQFSFVWERNERVRETERELEGTKREKDGDAEDDRR